MTPTDRLHADGQTVGRLSTRECDRRMPGDVEQLRELQRDVAHRLFDATDLDRRGAQPDCWNCQRRELLK